MSRIKRMLDAWRYFVRQLQKWARDKNAPSIEWLRVFEWERGSDDLGHPHLHIWIFSPFLERDLIVHWWTRALDRALEGGLEQVPILDIREVSDAESVEQELIKYLTKDIDAQGNKIDPEIYAQVYQALDGSRQLQTSRGFMTPKERGPLRCECGAKLPRKVTKKHPNNADDSDMPANTTLATCEGAT